MLEFMLAVVGTVLVCVTFGGNSSPESLQGWLQKAVLLNLSVRCLQSKVSQDLPAMLCESFPGPVTNIR